jgi:hypothetical protein
MDGARARGNGSAPPGESDSRFLASPVTFALILNPPPWDGVSTPDRTDDGGETSTPLELPGPLTEFSEEIEAER